MRKAEKVFYAVLAAAVLFTVLLLPVSAVTGPRPTPGGAAFPVLADTVLRGQSPSGAQSVSFRPAFAEPGNLSAFPINLGGWTMAQSYDWPAAREMLHPSALVGRDYYRAGDPRVYGLVLVAGYLGASYHPARICYADAGYTIRDDLTQIVPVPVARSANGQDRGNWTLKVERLVVDKTLGGRLQRILNLEVYIKMEFDGLAFNSEWVRTSLFENQSSNMATDQANLTQFIGAVASQLLAPPQGSVQEPTGPPSIGGYLFERAVDSARRA
jgi:hypothetical protein